MNRLYRAILKIVANRFQRSGRKDAEGAAVNCFALLRGTLGALVPIFMKIVMAFGFAVFMLLAGACGTACCGEWCRVGNRLVASRYP